MRRFFLTASIFILLVYTAKAQSSYQLGLLPSLNINKKLPKDWALHFKAESRQFLYQEDFSYDYALTDVALLASTRVRFNTRITMGYMVRIDGEEVKSRTIQQVSFARRNPHVNLAHRIAMDQTFSSSEDTELRFRYRLSSEIPLEGESLDPGEFFLKVSNEYINSFQGSDYDLEIRGATFVGYALLPSSKLELGLDYRASSFLVGQMRNRFWIGINFYQSI